MITRIIKDCGQCKKEFESWKCQKRKFCCKECFDCFQRENKYYKPIPSTAFKKNQIPHNKGIACSEEQKLKIKNTLTGKYREEKSPNWKGGKTTLGNAIRTSSKYIDWRTNVFKRDCFTCQKCFKRGGNLEVHHIIPFKKLLNSDIRTMNDALKLKPLWNINNGITLCKKCHSEIDKYRRVGN